MPLDGLDGLRAWIGEVERKLGMRTRVFLALGAIAIGAAGAAIYLAIDTRDSAVSEGDVQTLQRELEARIDGAGGAAGSTGQAQLESELATLQAEVAKLKGGGGTAGKGGTGQGGEGAGSAGESGKGTGGAGANSGANGTPAPGASPPSGSAAELAELVQKAKEDSEKAEGK